MPWKSNIAIDCIAGSTIVSADVIEWKAISAKNIGRIIIAGVGWLAWDSSYVLYLPDWEYGRGFVSDLATAPPFTMYAGQFLIQDSASILSSCPHSNITWD